MLIQLARKAKNRFFRDFSQKSYAQEGEDLILGRIFEKVERGFYVDIGAHHPKRFSNTYFFYQRGWRGINVDATPGSMIPFRRMRTRDRNLEIAVALDPGRKTFYLFDEPALNTFDTDLIPSRVDQGYRVVAKKEVLAMRLDELLHQHCPAQQPIHFLTIDVEGFDLQVLQSNDWTQFRPQVVVVECLSSDISQIEKSPVYQFLSAQNYALHAKTLNSYFFSDSTML